MQQSSHIGGGGFKFLLIVSVAAIVLRQSVIVGVRAVAIEDCSGQNAGAKLTYVDIENCGEKDLFCPFVRGTNASMEVAFKTSKLDADWTSAQTTQGATELL